MLIHTAYDQWKTNPGDDDESPRCVTDGCGNAALYGTTCAACNPLITRETPPASRKRRAPMQATFTRATRRQSKARIALLGPSGSGKTYTALKLARGLVGPEGRIALIDSERGSASKYADDVESFDVLELTTFAPEQYIAAMQAAGAAEYDALIIDSLSHAWAGPGGILEFVDKQAAKHRNNSYAAWREATPKHNALVDAILATPMHVIATMRTKMEYVVEKDEKTGKSTPRKIGMQPVQRDGLEYEFDVVADLDLAYNCIPSKTRVPFLAGQVFQKVGTELGEQLREWFDGGAAPVVPPPADAVAVPDAMQQLLALARELIERDGDKNAARMFCRAVTGKESSADLTAGETAEVIAALHRELHGDNGEAPADAAPTDEQQATA